MRLQMGSGRSSDLKRAVRAKCEIHKIRAGQVECNR